MIVPKIGTYIIGLLFVRNSYRFFGYDPKSEKPKSYKSAFQITWNFCTPLQGTNTYHENKNSIESHRFSAKYGTQLNVLNSSIIFVVTQSR